MDKELTTEEQLTVALQENESLKKEKASLKKQVSEQDEIIKDLQSKLELQAAAQQKAGGPLVITHNKESYKVGVSSFIFKGVEYKAEQLKKDSKLVKTLVEAGVGFLVKL